MEEQYIGNYRLTTELRGQNSGCARWGFAECGGEDFFIKEFISPVFPSEDSAISDEVRAALERECSDFEQKKSRLYNAINASSNGNIIGIRDFFRCGSHYYITTEKVETGMTNVKEISSLPNDKKQLLLRVLMYNVRCIHESGIVHADLKPSNLILKQTQNGFYTVKLIDFDSSFFENEPPENSDEVQGDLSYLAPETFLRIAGEDAPLGSAIDVFALGIIFHEFLCGVQPSFPSDYDYIYEAVLDEAPIKLNHRIPSKLSELIGRMLSLDPADRPTSAEVFDTLVGNTVQNDSYTETQSENRFRHDSSLD